MNNLIKCIHGGRVFDGRNFHEKGYMLVNGSVVEEVSSGDNLPGADEYIDIKNSILMPGLVDLHSDAAERCIEMRPGVFFDKDFALLNLDVRLASIGVTSFFHAVSFGEEKTDVRNKEISEALVEKINELGDQFRINHYVHFRYEVSSETGTPSLKKFLNGDKKLDLVSFMDHTPGQGQFRDMEEYKKFYCSNYGISDDEAHENGVKKQDGQKKAYERIFEVAKSLREMNIPLLSHDDDTIEKIDLLNDVGIIASEFPVTGDAAKYAYEKGLGVFMGAPNLLRGKSSNGHLNAEEIVEMGCCTGLLSDYYPESLLQAPFAAIKRTNIKPESALSLVTSGPGKLLPGNSSMGMLKKDSPADFIVVNDDNGFARVLQTWVSGKNVYMGA